MNPDMSCIQIRNISTPRDENSKRRKYLCVKKNLNFACSVWEVVKIVEGIDIILKVDCVLGLVGFSAVKRKKAPSVQRNFLFSRERTSFTCDTFQIIFVRFGGVIMSVHTLYFV